MTVAISFFFAEPFGIFYKICTYGHREGKYYSQHLPIPWGSAFFCDFYCRLQRSRQNDISQLQIKDKATIRRYAYPSWAFYRWVPSCFTLRSWSYRQLFQFRTHNKLFISYNTFRDSPIPWCSATPASLYKAKGKRWKQQYYFHCIPFAQAGQPLSAKSRLTDLIPRYSFRGRAKITWTCKLISLS